jgi:hypothetical protein
MSRYRKDVLDRVSTISISHFYRGAIWTFFFAVLRLFPFLTTVLFSDIEAYDFSVLLESDVTMPGLRVGEGMLALSVSACSWTFYSSLAANSIFSLNAFIVALVPNVFSFVCSLIIFFMKLRPPLKMPKMACFLRLSS